MGRDVLIAIIAELQAVIERLQRPRQLSGRICMLSRSVESDNRLEHDLRHHHFPTLAAQAIPVIGVGTLAVPFHDCHHRCEGQRTLDAALKPLASCPTTVPLWSSNSQRSAAIRA